MTSCLEIALTHFAATTNGGSHVQQNRWNVREREGGMKEGGTLVDARDVFSREDVTDYLPLLAVTQGFLYSCGGFGHTHCCELWLRSRAEQNSFSLFCCLTIVLSTCVGIGIAIIACCIFIQLKQNG